MIRHVVMLALKPDEMPANVQDVMKSLDELRPQIAGFVDFEHGPNRDIENKSPDYPYGFVCTFEDVGALRSYADNADHKMLGARLVAMCNGGADGIMVMDLDV